jgi:enoyl-CoA hydratase/carnithine racemase
VDKLEEHGPHRRAALITLERPEALNELSFGQIQV